jgi:hypothetical protein
MEPDQKTDKPVTAWMIIRPLLGLFTAVGAILLCVEAIVRVKGPLLADPYIWLGNTIVGLAFLGILVSGIIGIRCKVRFVVNLWGWIFRLFK